MENQSAIVREICKVIGEDDLQEVRLSMNKTPRNYEDFLTHRESSKVFPGKE